MFALAATVIATGCSGGGTKAARRVRTTSTSAPEVLDNRIVAGSDASDAAATRFTLGDGTTVLVPVGALAQGAEARVTTVAAEGLSQGAIEGGTTAYDVAVTAGAISKPIAVQLALADAPDRTGAVAVRWDEASKTWQPVNSTVSPGTLTIYAAKPGRYSWVRWNWQAATAVGVETVRALVGPIDPGEVDLACGSAGALALRFRTRSSGSDTLRWCAGVTGGVDGFAVANAAAAPVSLRQRGVGTGTFTRRDAVTGALAELVRRHAPTESGVGFDLLAPGEHVGYTLTADVEAAVAVAVDGMSQAYLSLGTAASFVAGLYAGSAPVGVAVLQRNDAVREALLAALDSPGCADAVVAAGSTSRPAVEWAGTVQRLVLSCVPATVVRQLVDASAKQSTVRGAFSAVTAAVPAASLPLVTTAIAQAVTPLVDIEGAGTVTLVPVPPEPTTTTTPGNVPGATTLAPGAGPTTSTTLVIRPTTVATAPPTGGTTTVVATATTSTTVAGPVGPALTAVGSTTCSDRGGAAGTVSLLGAGFTARAGYTLTFTSPTGARRNIGGTTTAAGAFSAVVDCRNQTLGDWSVTARDNPTGRVSDAVRFTVARL